MSEQLDTLVRELVKPSHYLTSVEYKALAENAIDELLRVVMERPDDNVPTYAEARLMFWIEKCKSQGCAPERAKPQPDDDSYVGKRYPADPYRAPTFSARVHLPDGTTQRWGPKKLREAGLLSGSHGRYSLPWSVNYGAELHVDADGKGYEVENPATFNKTAYDEWAQQH